MTDVLALTDITRRFAGTRAVHALSGVSLRVSAGETVALVGESGSGKSTLGRIALRLDRPTSGRVVLEGTDITDLPERRLRPLRAHIQMVFQDPWGTLNPRMSIAALLEEPFLLHTKLERAARSQAAQALAARVRLDSALLRRHPAQLSGGQLQRVAIARAIATRPRLVVLDEPTSSLDLSVRAGILALLAELRAETGAGYLFISHDLATVRGISERIAVLYLGRIVEQGPTQAVFASPAHPYTKALLSAELSTDPAKRRTRQILTGDPPSPVDLPPGCAFAARCPIVQPACRDRIPPPVTVAARHEVACLRVEGGPGALPLDPTRGPSPLDPRES